jgi:Zn-dependent protease/CBS domain-containing protein
MEQNAPQRQATRRGLRIGSVLGVPVHVSATWLIIAVFIVIGYAPLVASRLPGIPDAAAYATASGFVVILFLSVLLHELGHALTALRLGIGVQAMTLWMLGGYTELDHEPRTPGAEFAVAAAGPAVSFVLGALSSVAVAVLDPGTIAHELAFQAAVSNLSVAVFNVLPGLPLDGGSIVRSAIWKFAGNRNAGTIAGGWAGRAVAVAVIGFGLMSALFGAGGLGGSSLLLTLAVGVFLWFGASHAIAAGQLAGRLPSLVPRSLVRPALNVPAELPLAEALRRASEAGARGLVVVDSDGAASAVVTEHAVAATPAERRPWIPVGSVARTLEPGMIIPADLTGEALLQAMRACPATEYVVSEADRVVGILVAGDVAQTLDRKGSPR